MGTRTPFYAVTLEGIDITPWITSITLVEDDRQTDHVMLTIQDPRLLYADALFEGSWAEIDIGYAEANQHALMLRALITKVELRYPQDGIPTLTLKGEDKSIEMGLTERRKRWRDRTVTDIVKAVAAPYGFRRVEARLSPDPIPGKPIHQGGQTDLAFLQDLAETYHAKCFVELDEQGREVLYFIPERGIIQLQRADTLVLRYRMGPTSNLFSFTPSFDSSYIDRLKEINDIDDRGQRIESSEQPSPDIFIWPLNPVRLAQANNRDRTQIQQLYTQGVARKQNLQRQLTARRVTAGEVAPNQAQIESTNDTQEARRLGMTARGTTFGNIWLRAKSNVIVEGVSERFNGEWYVTNVTHKIDRGGYKTDFQCVR